MSYDPNNIFAKIIRGDAPCYKIYEDEKTLSFLDLFPQSRGHSLIVPKTAGENLLDTAPESVAAAMATVQRVAQAAQAALKPDGIAIMQFNGAPAGQTVFHLHFHVIPRFEGEPLKGHGKAGQADADALKALQAQLSEALAGAG
ncbi:MAG: HIT family protein [Pseudomonadota bacterium]